MAIKKLTLSVDADAIERARKFSALHDTSISRLVSGFLASLPLSGEPVTPRVRRLVGILPQDVNEDDFRRHLEDKHGR